VFVGHSLLAFVVLAGAVSVANATTRVDIEPSRALAIGAVGAAFAAVPDVDMVYALSGLLTTEFDGVFAVTGAFWAASTVVHRSITHSLVVAPLAAVAFALLATRPASDSAFPAGDSALPAGDSTLPAGDSALLEDATGFWQRRTVAWTLHALGIGVLLALTVVATANHGTLGVIVFGAFAATGVAVAAVVREYTTIPAATTAVAAVVGLATHPFGDVFTGTPPAFLWPFDATVLAERVELAADPTLHLVGAFAIELGVIALALVVYSHLVDEPRQVSPVSVTGVAYGALVVVMPPPTLDVSYHFVFSILAVGVVATTPELAARRTRLPTALAPPRISILPSNPLRSLQLARTIDRGTGLPAGRREYLDAVATGLATVAFALLAYTIAYLTVA
jgi:membrane-bound metal-dependent hydrolase YbcI (DUF457 family)